MDHPHSIERSGHQRQVEDSLLGLIEPARVPDTQRPSDPWIAFPHPDRIDSVGCVEHPRPLDAADGFQQATRQPIRRHDAVQDLAEAECIRIQIRLDRVDGHPASRRQARKTDLMQGREEIGDVDAEGDGGPLVRECLRQCAAPSLRRTRRARDPDPALVRVRGDQELGPVMARSLDQTEDRIPPSRRQSGDDVVQPCHEAAQRVGGSGDEQEPPVRHADRHSIIGATAPARSDAV